jgi:hypothetical protein
MPKLRKADLPDHFYRRLLPEDRLVKTRACDHPGCEAVGEYRAPRNRELDDSNPLTASGGGDRVSHWFCLSHVKAFNAQWNFYEGLSVDEMEAAIRFDGTWNRPSWPLGKADPGFAKARARRSRKKTADEKTQKGGKEPFIHRHAELEALAILDLQPPVDFSVVKKRYRLLVKHHHPDLQETEDERREAEEKIKNLNSAFTLLKNLYASE